MDFNQVANAIIAECIRRGYPRQLTVACLSTAIQESGLKMVWDPSHRWFGIYQQDGGYPNRADIMGNIRGFLDRLDVKLKHPGASPDPYKNIFWLQQRPSDPTADDAYMKGRRDYYKEISKNNTKADQLFSAYQPDAPATTPSDPPTGDPIWLPDVLRAAGLTVKEISGWKDRGHGDFGDIRGIVCHHTGSNNASAESIAFHPELGLASQLHLGRDGVWTVCGAGIAWHAGAGGGISWLPANNANRYTIGIEAANDGGGSPGKPHRSSWPDVQYNSYVRGVAAVLTHLQLRQDRAIGHKEWAGAAQGKWDPGAIDMNIFRTDVGALIGTVGDDELSAEAEKKINELHAALLGKKEARGLFAAPGEGEKWPWYELAQNDDGFIYEAAVIEYAKGGVDWAIEVLARTAAGQGKNKEQWVRDFAAHILKQCPEDSVARVLNS